MAIALAHKDEIGGGKNVLGSYSGLWNSYSSTRTLAKTNLFG